MKVKIFGSYYLNNSSPYNPETEVSPKDVGLVISGGMARRVAEGKNVPIEELVNYRGSVARTGIVRQRNPIGSMYNLMRDIGENPWKYK